MEIVYDPPERVIHACDEPLWELGTMKPGTVVKCDCGRLWRNGDYSFWDLLLRRKQASAKGQGRHWVSRGRDKGGDRVYV